MLTEATSPGAWRSEHDERFSLPNQHSRFATVTASVAPLVTGSQAGGLMDRINHVNRLLAEVEHIYPETATAAVATTTTTASSGVHDLGATNRSGRVVTAHEVAEVAEGVPVEDNVTENNDEKELLNLSQFVTDEITSVIDNALTTIDSSYTGHVTGKYISINVSSICYYYFTYLFFYLISSHLILFYCILYSWKY